MPLRILVLIGALVYPAAAGAVTLRDIIELTKAGLSDDVLIAVIEADRTIFTLDTDQILELKKAGVSEAVLLKMIRTRQEHGPADTASSPAPEPEHPGLVVIGSPPPPVTVVVPQYVLPQYVVPHYYVVPFSIWGTPRVHAPRTPPPPVLAPEHRGFGRFINGTQ